MNSRHCATDTSLTTLIGYWFGELEAAEEATLEEHLFGCDECHARLRELVMLGRDIRHTVRAGHLNTVVTPAFVTRLQDAGLRVREYRLQPSSSVLCTIAPEDDLVVAHLEAALGGIRRLDLVFYDETNRAQGRIEDITFADDAKEITLANDVTALRQLSFATQRVELVAVEDSNERVIASYTFNHSPYQVSPPTQ